MSETAAGTGGLAVPMPQTHRMATRVASFAILAVLLALAACAAWGAGMTYRADVAVKRATEASNAVEQARKAVMAERAVRRATSGPPGDDAKARHHEAALAVASSLQTAHVFSEGLNRRLIDDLSVRHGQYLRVAGVAWGEAADEALPLRVFDPARGEAFRADGALTTLEADIDHVAERLRVEALGLLQLLVTIQTRVLIGGPALFVLGLMLVGALWRMQRGEQRAGMSRMVESAFAANEVDRRLSSVLQSAPEAVLLCSGPGSVVYVNNAAETLWAPGSGQLEGQSILMLAHLEDRAALRVWWERLGPAPDGDRAAAAGVARSEVVLRLRDGTNRWRWAQITGANLLEDPAVHAMILVVRPVEDPQHATQQAAAQVLLDPLTRLPNSALLRDRLGQAMARAGRRGDKVGVLMIGLEPTPHVAADAMEAVALEAATRIQACIRPQDTVGRLDGLCFAVVREASGEDTDLVGVAEAIAAQFGRALAGRGHGEGMALEHDGEPSLLARIGIVLGDPLQDTVDGLLRNAVLVMQQVPETGEPRHLQFQSGPRSEVLDRVELEGDLRSAVHRLVRGAVGDNSSDVFLLEGGLADRDAQAVSVAAPLPPPREFRVHYQPIVTLRDSVVCGFEALLRWQHPVLGVVPSGSLFPIAEETGLIVPLGQWVLEEACRQVVAWQKQVGPQADLPGGLTLGVNLSSQQFHRPGLVEDVVRALALSGLPGSCLRLEVTEATIMRDADHAVQALWKLKELGVQLAIDDFGGGYSALGYLKQLPIGLLKIDGSFIRGIGLDQENTSITRAVMSLAKSLGWGVSAEGIETQAQARLLTEWNCDFGQGYYFGRPLDGPEAAEFLHGGSIRARAPDRARAVPA